MQFFQFSLGSLEGLRKKNLSLSNRKGNYEIKDIFFVCRSKKINKLPFLGKSQVHIN